VILVVAVVLWIVWVAPYVLRNRRHQFQAAGEMTADAPATESSDPRAGTVMNITAQQEKAMDIRKIPAAAQDTDAAEPAARAASGEFRIRYGRTAIALAALMALLTAFIAGVLLPFGLGTPLLPVSAFLVAIGSLALLRSLALRDRRKKVNAAFRAAMGTPARQDGHADRAPARPPQPAFQPDSPLFDAEAHKPQSKPLTAVELREAALAVAREAGDTSARTAKDAGSGGEPWEPVDVPKPVYVEAAKAERPAPEPLDLPEAPKAVGKPSLKQGAPAAPAAAQAAKPLTKAQSALSNLDDVLQRRRA
jgi:hypothetical protein